MQLRDLQILEALTAAHALVGAVQTDNSQHGGLISRETIRLSDELRMALSRLSECDNDDAGSTTASVHAPL
jgi:hypothetical protein